jgi:hypothetical protein
MLHKLGDHCTENSHVGVKPTVMLIQADIVDSVAVLSEARTWCNIYDKIENSI